MAKTKISRTGYGYVEPNHLSGQRTSQNYAQLPMADDIDILENGQFVKYDYVNKEVNFTGKGEWLLVFNERKNYDERYPDNKDFAMIKSNYTPGPQAEDMEILGLASPEELTLYGTGPFLGQAVPRCLKTNVQDIMTLNTFGDNNKSNVALAEGIEVEEGDILSPNAKGFLALDGDGTMEWQVVKVYTMPNGGPGVKVQRIK